MLVAALADSVPASVAALVVAGLAWIGVLSTLNASAQLLVPDWTRARGLAFYTLTFMGGQASAASVVGDARVDRRPRRRARRGCCRPLAGVLLGLRPLALRASEIDSATPASGLSRTLLEPIRPRGRCW